MKFIEVLEFDEGKPGKDVMLNISAIVSYFIKGKEGSSTIYITATDGRKYQYYDQIDFFKEALGIA